MRPLLLACPLLLLLVACAGAGTSTPALTPAPPARSAARLISEFEEAGLLVHRSGSSTTYPCATQQQGLLDYQEFTQRDLPNETRQAAASFDTAQHAEQARVACSSNRLRSTSAWRRDTVILIWSSDSSGALELWHPYFTILQAPH